jgi:Zn-dependent protease with chaperone function
VFVNTGFLDVLSGYDNRDDTLASVIGHEMSHALLRHAAEKISIQPIADVAGFFAQSALWFYLPEGSEIALEFLNKTAEQAMGAFLELPFSRTCELEADQVGLLIAAKACYDPSKVPKFWEFCEGKGLGQSELDAFLSTHPGSLSRMELLEETLPSAQHSYRSARAQADFNRCTPTFGTASIQVSRSPSRLIDVQTDSRTCG